MEDKFQRLLDAIDASKKDLQTEFSTKITKLQQEVTAGQESSSKEVVQKIQKRAYQFRRKGNEEQFKFNSAVEEHFDAAKKELGKLEPRGEAEKKIVEHMKAHLDEGTKTIAVHQKHIKIADRSDLGWAVVEAYMDDELASDSDDWREEAVQGQSRGPVEYEEEAIGECGCSGKEESNSEPGAPASSARRLSQGTRPLVSRPRMIGPCYRCGEMGHLVVNCPKPRQQYPFEQSLVKGTDLGMSFVSRECVDVIKKVDIEKAEWAALSPEGVDNVIAIEQGKVSEPETLISDTWHYGDYTAMDNCGPEIALYLDSESRGWETP